MSFQKASSGSSENRGHANVDERKRKRTISNRESARRSRMKKQQRLDELIGQVNSMRSENAHVVQKIDSLSQHYSAIESENKVLRAQLMELTDRLRSLNSVLQIAEEVSGVSMDIPEIPDTLTESWRLPCPVHLVTATSDGFQF